MSWKRTIRQIAAASVAAAIAWMFTRYLLNLSVVESVIPAAIMLGLMALVAKLPIWIAATGSVASWLVLLILTNWGSISPLIPGIPALCDGENCTVQGWMSASSGWAAVILAAVGFIFLQRQINEQKRQTDFIIGNEDPTLDSVQHLKDPEEIVLRLVNWNRRGILIHDVDFLDRDWFTGILEVKIDGTIVENPQLPLFLRGWEDRNNEGPRTVQFSLAAHERNANVLIKDWPKGQEIFAQIQILGERHVSKRLSCFLPE